MASQPGTGGGGIDFGRAFQFYFEDPEWPRKTLIGGALYLGGFIGLIFLGAGLLLIAMVMGYTMRVMQRAYAGDPRPLPEWEDYGGLMRDGLKLMLLSLAYWAVFSGLPTLVIFVLGAVARATGSAAAAGVVALVSLLLWLVFGVLSLGVSLYMPAAVARATLYQRLGAGFEFKENLALIRRNPANYFVALLIIILTSVLAVFGLCVCILGVFATTFWSACVFGYLMGEVVRRDPLIGQPLAPAEPEPSPGL